MRDILSDYVRVLYELTSTAGSAQELDSIVARFVNHVHGRHHGFLFTRIVAAFEIYCNRQERRIPVLISSAHEIPDSNVKIVESAIKHRVGCELEIRYELDPHLIGGVTARTPDLFIDASVRGILNSLARF